MHLFSLQGHERPSLVLRAAPLLGICDLLRDFLFNKLFPLLHCGEMGLHLGRSFSYPRLRRGLLLLAKEVVHLALAVLGKAATAAEWKGAAAAVRLAPPAPAL